MSDPATIVLPVPDDLVETLARRAAEIIRADQRFLSKSAMAEYLGITERRLKTLREHGLPACRVGRDLYFDVREVNAWIERHPA